MRYVLICGDRNWKDDELIFDVFNALLKSGEDCILHGNAKGADSIAGELAESMDFSVFPFPADWEKYGKSAGPIRNRKMLDMRPRMVIAFHDDIENSKGTKDCVNEARKRKILTLVVSH